MTPNLRWITALILLSLGAACSWPTDLGRRESFRVRADFPYLVLSNRSDRPIFYYAYEEEAAALSFFGACEHPAHCPHVSPAGRIRLPYDSIAGYTLGAEVAFVYWWHLVPQASGGFRPDSVRTERVHLR